MGEKDNFLQLSYNDVKWFEERGCKWSKIVAPKVRPIRMNNPIMCFETTLFLRYIVLHTLSLVCLPVSPSWQGCVIIWDGRLIHSTCKPLRGRADPKPRFIVYGGWVPRSLLTGTRHSIQNRPQKYIMYMHCSQRSFSILRFCVPERSSRWTQCVSDVSF